MRDRLKMPARHAAGLLAAVALLLSGCPARPDLAAYQYCTAGSDGGFHCGADAVGQDATVADTVADVAVAADSGTDAQGVADVVDASDVPGVSDVLDANDTSDVGDVADASDLPDVSVVPDISEDVPLPDVGADVLVDATEVLDADTQAEIAVMDSDAADEDADSSEVATCGTASVDQDQDGAPDCAEIAANCPEGAVLDKAVYPGAAESCDGKDNDCNGLTDDNIGLGMACDGPDSDQCKNGVAVCGADGNVVCGTESKPSVEETCNGVDDDCNGATDDGLDPKTSGCNQSGVCAQALSAKCMGGKWNCSYANFGFEVKETLCDSQDNDCNGVTDGGLGLGSGCDGPDSDQCKNGVNVCDGNGKVTCGTENTQNIVEICNGVDDNCDGATDEGCSSETCNGLDDNKNGQTDEGCDDDKDGYCDVGMTLMGNPATCLKGGGDCVDTDNSVQPGQVEGCDGKDNDCNGATDDGLDPKTSGCNQSGVCAQALSAKCMGGKWNCSYANFGFEAKETLCDSQDNDCNGVTDDPYPNNGKPCDGPDADQCKSGTLVCDAGQKSLSCLEPAGSGAPTAESCDGKDNDCNGATDENFPEVGQACEGADGDLCAYGTWTCGKSGAGVECVNEVVKNLVEICNNKDDDCNGKTDEGLGLGSGCDGPDSDLCKNGVNVCDGNGKVTCGAETKQNIAEICNDFDDDCNGLTDEGCDDDKDLYCDSGLAVIGVPKVCPKSKANTGDDCNDAIKSVNPGATELCDDIDNGCSAGTDEGCDLDKDAWCTAGMVVVGSPKVCVNGSGDCNDAKPLVNPGVAKDTCATAGVDDNCDGQTDQVDSVQCVAHFKDFDGDTFGTGSSSCTCDPDLASKFTATKGGDCNDANASINPGVTKDSCSTPGVDDNCDAKIDPEGAVGCTVFWIDGDGDTFGSGNSQCLCKADPKTQFTALKNGDCDDTKGAVNPGATEICNGVDDNCDNKVDPQDAQGCKAYFLDGDGDTYGALGSTAKCQCAPDLLTKYKALVAGDCNDINPGVNPVATESCNGVDDNCDSKIDPQDSQGCKDYYIDSDGDTYGAKGAPAKCQCAPDLLTKIKALVAGDCNDVAAGVNPGATDSCATVGVDDNCDGKTDEACLPEVCNGADDDGNGKTDDVACGSGACTCAANGVATCPSDCAVCPDDGDLAIAIDDAGVKKVVCAHDYPAWGNQPLSPVTFAADASGTTVADSLTGLTWQKTVDTGKYTWAGAKTYCDGLVLAGKSDWRAPTSFELENAVDYTKTSNCAVMPTAFGSYPCLYYWSATPFQGGSSSAWYVGFNYGGFSGDLDVTANMFVRCVR